MSFRNLPLSVMSELKVNAVNQNSLLKRIIMSLSELIQLKTNHNQQKNMVEVRRKQEKLSEVIAMIHAGHVNHRCVRDIGCDNTTTVNATRLNQENILTTLVGDYFLAQSSVDMAYLRYPRTLGLIAEGIESYARGEFLKLQLLKDKFCRGAQLKCQIERYAGLTCGSLLSTGCLSAALLAGHPDRDATNISSSNNDAMNLSDLVYDFGFHAGTAHGLIELLYYPNRNSEADGAFIKTLDASQFDDSIRNHIDKSIKLMLSLSDKTQCIGSKNKLLTMLEDMKSHYRID